MTRAANASPGIFLFDFNRELPSMSATSCIFHIATRKELDAARSSGEHRPPSLAAEGFIHFSQAHQVRGVLDAFYTGRQDLVLLVVDPGLLTSPLRYEPPATPAGAHGGDRIPRDQLFPHLYGPLNADAIVDHVDAARFQGRPVHADTAAMLRHYRFDRLPVEGTLYRSTWRSEAASVAGGPAGTAMVGMYAESPESLSCFHRLAYDEVWHVYGGDPFMLYLLYPDGSSREVSMGTDVLAGQQVQFLVPRGVWQAGCLVPGGRYALFGCTMAPGFTGDCFEAGNPDELCLRYPDRSGIIRRLAVNGTAQYMPQGFAN